jgi:hypothetical protein
MAIRFGVCNAGECAMGEKNKKEERRIFFIGREKKCLLASFGFRDDVSDLQVCIF